MQDKQVEDLLLIPRKANALTLAGDPLRRVSSTQERSPSPTNPLAAWLLVERPRGLREHPMDLWQAAEDLPAAPVGHTLSTRQTTRAVLCTWKLLITVS